MIISIIIIVIICVIIIASIIISVGYMLLKLFIITPKRYIQPQAVDKSLPFYQPIYNNIWMKHIHCNIT